MPKCKNNVMCNTSSFFTLGGNYLNYVAEFVYLGHIIDNEVCNFRCWSGDKAFVH